MKTKKKSGKRFLSWLLAAVMIIALMPATAFAEPPTESSGNTEPAVTSYCPEPEGDTDVSVGGDDSSPAAETKDTPTEEPAKDTPTAEPAKDTPTAEPAKDTPTAEPVKESPVADKTTEGAPAQEGAVENSTDEKITEDSKNEVSAAELAGLTAMLGVPELLELYAWKSYHVYVYGCFKHNDNYLAENAALYINGKKTAIEWNGDASKGEYYITFGKLENATTEKPSRYKNNNEVPEWQISTNNIKSRIAKGEVILASESTNGSAQKNGLATTGEDVNKYVNDNWSGLKPRKGAEGFPETKTDWSWHIDGTINVYRVYYTRGNLPANEDFNPPKESTYFLDDYTVRGQKPTSKNYKFTGWEYNGKTYNQGDKVPASNTDITLEAQWAEKEKVYTVNYEWNGDIPSDLSTPSLPTPNEFTSMESVRNAKDATFIQGYKHTTTDGTYTFSGWTENKGTTDYSGDKIVTPITYKGTWTFEAKPVTNYKVAYKWADDSPKDVDLPAKDDTIYDSPEAVLAAVNKVDTTNFKSTEPRQGVAGTWTFDKWEKSSSSDSVTGHVTTTTITYTGTWTFTPTPVTNYKIAYKWADDSPKDVDLPAKDDTIYDSPEAVLAAVNKVDTTNFKSTEPRQGVAGTWTFDKWEKSSSSDSVTGHVTTTTITYTGTWTFTPTPVTNYKIAYKWADDSPKDVDLPAKDDTIYDSPEAVLAAVNKVDTTNFKSTEPRQGVAGTWTFDKWEKSSSSDSVTGHVTTTTITYTGTWTFTPTPVTNYKIAYKWADDSPKDVDLPAKDDTIYDSPEAVLAAVNKVDTTNFKSTEPKQGIAGTWTFKDWTEYPNHETSTNGHVTTITITYIGSWNFTPSETKTITDVLNSLVQKEFESQYGYSTEGTFTAIAKVMPVHPEINSYAAEVDESSDNNTNTPGTDKPKTFTGTVNLKTGDTKPFKFSAGEGVADELEPYTHYAVYISEDKGNLSKVTYDTTKYILDFATGKNSEVLPKSIHIWTGEDIAEGEEGKEPTPVEGTTITFKNIYTYKRHHSSGDSGNGGGKKEEKPTVEIKDDDALGLNNTDHFAYIVGYGNGEVRPQNSITRAEVAAIFFRLLEDDVRDANYTRQNKFTDVSNDAWYCSAVSTLSAMGIISGYPDATFRPNASITRAEFAAIATRFDVNGDKTPASFNDIADHWAKDEIAVAANNGWVNGYEDGSFRPQNKITRAETMSLVNRVLNRKPETAEDLLENMAKWTDNADTNAWYYLAVQEATNSHYYEYKENSQYEKWTELRETRDWSELDK